MNDDLFLIRAFQPSDLSFIYSSWLSSYRAHSSLKILPKFEYYPRQKEVLQTLFFQRPLLIRIACAKDYPDQIFGYIVSESEKDALLIHYGYVKSMYRKLGIFEKLLKEVQDFQTEKEVRPLYYTHRTKDGVSLGMKYQARFNPLRLNRFVEGEKREV